MVCPDYKYLLDMFLDNELEADEALDVEEHFTSCDSCFEYVRNARSLKARLQEENARIVPPASLAKEIKAALDSEDRRKLTVIVAKFAPLAAAAGILAGLFLWSGSAKDLPFVEPVLAVHAQNLPMDVKENDPERVAGWFRGRVPFAVRPPMFGRPDIRLVGARLASLDKRLAAYIAYKKGEKKYSLFVFEPQQKDLEISGARIAVVNRKPVYVMHRHGYSIMLWKDGQLAYLMAADTGTDDLLALAHNALGR